MLHFAALLSLFFPDSIAEIIVFITNISLSRTCGKFLQKCIIAQFPCWRKNKKTNPPRNWQLTPWKLMPKGDDPASFWGNLGLCSGGVSPVSSREGSKNLGYLLPWCHTIWSWHNTSPRCITPASGHPQHRFPGDLWPPPMLLAIHLPFREVLQNTTNRHCTYIYIITRNTYIFQMCSNRSLY